MICYFVSDLHGSIDRYRKLFAAIREERPQAVFYGGDLLPTSPQSCLLDHHHGFVEEFLVPACLELRADCGNTYPRMFIILGNDDPRSVESSLLDGVDSGHWEYVHGRCVSFGDYRVMGYSCVPPTPFLLKDWERYDVSRFVDVGCVSPEDGHYSVSASVQEMRYSTIQAELEGFGSGLDYARTICLFHSPPYRTHLDRAALDGKMIDMVPLDVHVGSIAIRRFIENHQPLITLHGHVHESAHMTGFWRDQIGSTVMLTAAHDGPELALVKFDPSTPDKVERRLL